MINGKKLNCLPQGKCFLEILPTILFGAFLWFSFLRLPASTKIEDAPSWEPVLSYIASHHLQWGKDVVFTYGPLEFLTLDYYWGAHFKSILFYAVGFSLFLTILVLRFLNRLPSILRLLFCVMLPWLTVPHWQDLGIDPIYLFAISAIGISAMPDERPGLFRLAVYGAALGCFGLIKFSFCIFSIFTLLLVAVGHGVRRDGRAAGVCIISSILSFLAAWILAGQNPCNIGNWFFYATQIAGEYSSAMIIIPNNAEMTIGVLTAFIVVVLLLGQYLLSTKKWSETLRLILLLVGLFLAWKEAFVRADFHIVIFQFYAFLIVAMIPAWMCLDGKKRQWISVASIFAMILVLLPFNQRSAEFMVTAKDGLATKISDTATSVFAPGQFKQSLETELDVRRKQVMLPQISAVVGDKAVGVLNYDQDVAILNGFNYQPHPVFQSYCAHTPELERLNEIFLNSAAAPEFILWRFGTIDGRFPSLDDGRVLLKLLADYSPVISENKFVLWKRNPQAGQSYSIGEPAVGQAAIDEWIPVPYSPAWVQVEFHETIFGMVRKFLLRGDMPKLEVRLVDGKISEFRLPPGNAKSGFVMNPLLTSESNLGNPIVGGARPSKIVAFRLHADRTCFTDLMSIRMSKIENVAVLQGQ